MNIKKEFSIQDYYQQIADAQKKIEELRAVCNHLEFQVNMYMWRPGAMQPQRICKACDAVVPGITEEETKKAWDEWTMGCLTNSGAGSFTVFNNGIKNG